jgi:hypothetical protein
MNATNVPEQHPSIANFALGLENQFDNAVDPVANNPTDDVDKQLL